MGDLTAWTEAVGAVTAAFVAAGSSIVTTVIVILAQSQQAKWRHKWETSIVDYKAAIEREENNWKHTKEVLYPFSCDIFAMVQAFHELARRADQLDDETLIERAGEAIQCHARVSDFLKRSTPLLARDDLPKQVQALQADLMAVLLDLARTKAERQLKADAIHKHVRKIDEDGRRVTALIVRRFNPALASEILDPKQLSLSDSGAYPTFRAAAAAGGNGH